MPTIEVTVIVKVDGVDAPNTPITSRLAVAGDQGFDSSHASTGAYAQVGSIADVGMVLLRTLDQVVTVRLDAQSDAGLVLNAGGFLLAFNCDIDAGATTNIKVNNNSGSATQLQGIIGGT